MSALDAPTRVSRTACEVEVQCIGRSSECLCLHGRARANNPARNHSNEGENEGLSGPAPVAGPARTQHLNEMLRALARWSASPGKRETTLQAPDRGRTNLAA